MPIENAFVSEPLAITSLIAERSRVLGLTHAGLVRRTNYKNIAKGLRRLDELLSGELSKTRGLIRALPAALDVPPDVVEHAIKDTRRQVAYAEETACQAREVAWRAAFKPHAIILTERTIPQPAFVAAVMGVERLLRMDFDLALPPVSYIGQALAGIRRKLTEFRSQSGRIAEALPAFGRPTGVVVNYTPDRAIRFDLDGNALEILPRACRPAEAYITVRGQPIPPATLRAVMQFE